MKRPLRERDHLVELGDELDEGTVPADGSGRPHTGVRVCLADCRHLGERPRFERLNLQVGSTVSHRRNQVCQGNARVRGPPAQRGVLKPGPEEHARDGRDRCGERPSGETGWNRRVRCSNGRREYERKEQRCLRGRDISAEDGGERDHEADNEHDRGSRSGDERDGRSERYEHRTGERRSNVRSGTRAPRAAEIRHDQ